VKFYVGTTFTRYREARALIDTFQALGHECAEDWTRNSHDFDSDGNLVESAGTGYEEREHWLETANKEKDAQRDIAADGGFCVFLGEEASRGWVAEQAYADAFGVPLIIVVNPFKVSIFDSLPSTHVVSSKQEALAIVMGAYGDCRAKAS
jgi:hypothetical protein